jgi:hypothetical protein
MNPKEWLAENAPGFDRLSADDREALMDFALLWTLFEARALGTNASAQAIIALVKKWKTQGRLKENTVQFAQGLDHFKNRYFRNGDFTEHLQSLQLRSNDKPELVKDVLSGQNNNLADGVTALLIIVYRLRNNFFHGAKWAYEIRGQKENFSYANLVLISALEVHGGL